MEITRILRRHRSLLLSAGVMVWVLLAAAAEVAVWHQEWVTPYLGGDNLVWLRAAADALTLLACGFSFDILLRVTWSMRRNSVVRTAAFGLAFVMFFAGLRRLVDLTQLQSPPSNGIAEPISSMTYLLLAASVLLLLPLLRKVVEFGTAAEIAQERFLSAAETGRQAFFILECERGPLRKIVDFRFTFVNANAEKLLLMQRRDLIGTELSKALPTLPDASLFERLKQVERTGLPYTGEVRYTSEAGDELWFDLRAVKMQRGIAVTLHDLSSERSKQRQVDDLYRFSQSLIQDAPFAILATDAAGIITAINPAAERLTQFNSHSVVGHASLVDLHDPEELRDRVMGATGRDSGVAALSFDSLRKLLGQRASAEDDWHYVCADGSRVPVHVSLTTLRGDDGEITGYLATAYDISERRKLTESITFLAQHDALTGLPNRMRLRERLEEALERARRLNQPVAVLSIGLDNFKRVNDSLGHTVGDELLVAMAERLRATTRCNDTVARAGGDTFVVVMPNCGSQEDATRAAGRLSGKLQTAMHLAERDLTVTASFGLALFPEWGDDAASLLRHADAAMYAAKRGGRNCLQVYSDALTESAADELELESHLRQSLLNDQMVLYYQPMVSCRGGEMEAVEALLRWRHPQRGLLAPAEFIAAAEETGFILQLGQWVIERACVEGRRLKEKLGRKVTVAVNLSPRQFVQQNLAEIVEHALRTSGLTAEDLELEITEYTLMISSAETLAALARLRALGVKVALDDFGTGFSSFKYLLDYKVDCLKIDRSFVAKCPGDPHAASIVRAVVAMAHGLNMEVVAEGVETEEQLAFLAHRRCDRAQGFYFGRPMPMDALIATVQASPHLAPTRTARVTDVRAHELVS
jgi:diguanylate cyclase (GGDEF)-like protein/PAS domain S-box-containing protein